MSDERAAACRDAGLDEKRLADFYAASRVRRLTDDEVAVVCSAVRCPSRSKLPSWFCKDYDAYNAALGPERVAATFELIATGMIFITSVPAGTDANDRRAMAGVVLQTIFERNLQIFTLPPVQ